MKRTVLWPQLHIGGKTVYSDRKGIILVLPRGERPIRITVEELPAAKPAGRRRA